MNRYKIKNNKSGSAFIIVIGVLSVIIFAACMFMTSTIEEGRQTNMSIRGLHAASLAEAAMERAMHVLSKKINKVDPSTASANDLSILLRLPCSEGSSTMGQSENFGSDKALNLSDECKKEIILTKDDLQGEEFGTDLDELVDYMTDKGAKSYEITVKAKVAQAFRNSPGNDYPDYKIPGVDIGWNTRYDVKSFLNGEGYTAFDIKIPEGIKWLSFSIPINIGGIKLLDINVTNIVGGLLPDISVGGTSYTFEEFTEVSTLCDLLLNQLIAKGAKQIYPIHVKFDKFDMPKSVGELWPAGTPVSEGDGQYLEKYGQLSLECEAKISYQDRQTAARRVTATKDFKVADCEPPAPMYSFFINNMQNEAISFNNYGGQFYINNFDYTGVLSKVKQAITGAFSGGNTASDDEGKEIPGLIRVNYKDESGTNPLICNVGLVGDWGGQPIEGESDNIAAKLFSGIEALMILCPDTSMAVVGAKYTLNTAVNKKNPDTNESVPVKLKGTYEKGQTGTNPFAGASFADFSAKITGIREGGLAKASDLLKSMAGLGGINLVPDVGGMSTNVIALAITLALKPLTENVTSALGVNGIGVPDCFQSWDMPTMGTKNSLYPIPTTGTGSNKTHFFGYGGLHPTLTKEIEGNVMKYYRQWAMCIVGMNATDRLPLLPFPPVFLPPAPLVIPIWKAGEIIEKYDFNLENFKAHGDDGKADMEANAYDPALLENMPPNLYTNEQYAKKATYYYENAQAFIEDLPNRTTEIDGKTVFVLNGISYISGSVGEPNNPFTVEGGDTLYVCGKGMIVCSGNFYMGCNIVSIDRNEEEPTVFSLICRKGGLMVMTGGLKLRFEGSLYTELGMFVHQNSSLHIVGNWVTNAFNKAAMGGNVAIDYVSSRVRTSLGSLHPIRGKYDPRRYHVSFSPVWASWRAH